VGGREGGREGGEEREAADVREESRGGSLVQSTKRSKEKNSSKVKE